MPLLHFARCVIVLGIVGRTLAVYSQGPQQGQHGSSNGGAFNSGYSNNFGGGGGGERGGNTGSRATVDPIVALGQAIGGGGVPGVDYPILSFVPATDFSCEGQLPGYYADTAPEARCQVFHICQFDGRRDSFLCPNGTLFNQQYFVCDWWYNFDCATATQLYALNAEFGKVPTTTQVAFRGNGGINVGSTNFNYGDVSGNRLYQTPS